jgi:hypothetical protein
MVRLRTPFVARAALVVNARAAAQQLLHEREVAQPDRAINRRAVSGAADVDVGLASTSAPERFHLGW